MKRHAALATVLLLAAGPALAGSQPTENQPESAKGCLALKVSSSAGSTKGGGTKTGTRFSATQVLDLGLMLYLPWDADPGQAIEEGERIRFRVYTPSGDLYQEMDVPIAAAGSKETERQLLGYPFPVKVSQAKVGYLARIPAWVVETSFPVGGTLIQSHSIYGKWRVEGTRGEAPPCQAVFEIEP